MLPSTTQTAVRARRWPPRFSLKWLFAAMLAGALLFNAHRPGPPVPQLSVSRQPCRGGDIVHLYCIWYPDGTSEQFLDMEPFGSLKRTLLTRADEWGTEEGIYQSSDFEMRYFHGLRHEGLIRPGDEVHCIARFHALRVMLGRQGLHAETCELGERDAVIDLPQDWPRLADIIRRSRGQ